MLSLILAALLQAAPEAGAAAPKDNGLPKTDYELVAWCHGALAGQLELDPIAKADMEKIEGKAKVAARAKADAEMEAERRVYLKDYEHALAAAEAASPTNIHQKGVQAELQGYRLWTETRNKAPIWRMLDWGMWDPNDVGCGDAAKRLYNKASLFGEALKGAPEKDAAAGDARPEPTAAPLATESDGLASKLNGAHPADGALTAAAADTQPTAAETAAATAEPKGEAPAADAAPEPARADARPVKAAAKKRSVKRAAVKPTPAEAPAVAEPAKAEAAAEAQPATAPATTTDAPAAEAPAKPALAKKTRAPAKKPVAKKKLSMDSSAEDIRAAIAAGKAETGVTEPAKDAPAPAPDKPADPGLRGPQ